MREFVRKMHAVDREVREQGEELDQVMRYWVNLRGAHVAAWLIRSHLDSFHENGAVDFHIGVHQVTPSWFRIAVAKLQESKHWSVEITHGPTFRTYRVRWTQWKTFLPESAYD